MFKSFSNIVLIVATLVCSIGLSGCGGEASKAAGGFQRQAVLVKVSTATTQTVTDSSVFTGTAKSRHSVSLSPQIEGQVTKIFVQAGDVVRQGQTLLEISPEKQQASVNSYKFAAWSSEKDLANAEKTLMSLQSQKQAKVSNLRLAHNNKERYAALASTGAVSTMDYDQRVNAFEAAKADVDAIEAQIDAQKAAVDKMKHQTLQSASNLKEQQVQLQYFTVKAPFNGVVGEIPVKLGNFVNTSTVLTTVTQNSPLEVYVEVPVERSADLKKGTVVQLLDQDEQPLGLSKVFFIAPNVSPDNQTILVKSEYKNEKGNLRADQLLKARIVWTTHTGLTVPTEAVCHQTGEDFMFLVDKSKDKANEFVAKQVAVKLGDIENSRYQVVNGIKAGDQIIVSGVQNLADKAPISIAQ